MGRIRVLNSDCSGPVYDSLLTFTELRWLFLDGRLPAQAESGLPPRSFSSQGSGLCRDIFMMDMHVDVHVGKRTRHAAGFIAFDQTQAGQHLHILVDALDIAPGPPRKLTHRHRTLPMQGDYQGPAAFGQPAEERAGAFEVQRLALVSVSLTGLARLQQSRTPVGRHGDGERASCCHGVFLAASTAAMTSSTKASTVVKV